MIQNQGNPSQLMKIIQRLNSTSKNPPEEEYRGRMPSITNSTPTLNQDDTSKGNFYSNYHLQRLSSKNSNSESTLSQHNGNSNIEKMVQRKISSSSSQSDLINRDRNYQYFQRQLSRRSYKSSQNSSKRSSQISHETDYSQSSSQDVFSSDCDKSEVSQASNGGQLYKMRQIFEQKGPSPNNNNADRQKTIVPCPNGNVANLRSKISPALSRNISQESNFSLNSVLSKLSNTHNRPSFASESDLCFDKKPPDPHYENMMPSPLIRTPNKKKSHNTLIDEITFNFNEARCRQSIYSSNSSISESYDVIDYTMVPNLNYRSADLCGPFQDMGLYDIPKELGKVDDTGGDSDGTYESVDFQQSKSNMSDTSSIYETYNHSNAITDAELGLEGENNTAPATAKNIAYKRTVQHLAESKLEMLEKEVKDRVDELIRTEVAYIEVLKHIVLDYIPELNRKDVPHSAEFTKANIFANIEEIYKFHSEKLYPKMIRNRRNINRLANVFIELDGMFMVYDEYYKNKSKSTFVIHEHRQFFMRKQKELGSKLDLASCLLGPVQRLPRYSLMLDALLKSYTKYVTFLKEEAHYGEGNVEKLNFGSSHESDEEEVVDHDIDMKCIEKARDGIKSTLNKIENNMVLVNIKKLKVNLNDLGSLLRHDEFSVTPAEQKRSWLMRCFLFEVALLFTIVDKSSDEIYIFHDCIELSKLGFTPPENDSSYRFSVWSEKRNLKNYALEAAPKVSADWVKCISALLWEEAASKKEKLKKEQNIKWKDSMRSVKRPSMHRGLPEKPAPPPQSTKPTLNDTKSMSDKRKKRKKEVNSNVHDALKFVGSTPNGIPNEINEGKGARSSTTWFIENSEEYLIELNKMIQNAKK